MSSEWGRDQNAAAQVEAEAKSARLLAEREGGVLRALAEAVASVIEADPHQWSPRPCTTCRVVSGLLGRPFGCAAKGSR